MIIVNGIKISNGKNIVMSNGKVFVDGKEVEQLDRYGKTININITIEKDTTVENIEVEYGNVVINGDVNGNVKSVSGDVTCGNVGGNVKTVSGDVDCNNIGGGITTVSGDINKN